MMILTMYAANNKASKYIKQKLTRAERRKKIHPPSQMQISTSLLTTNRITRQKMSKVTEA